MEPGSAPIRPALSRALASFVEASGVTVTVVDGALGRVEGPLVSGRIAAVLEQHGAWREDGGATAVEGRLTARCVQARAAVSERVGGLLRVDGIPMLVDGRVHGVLVCGWVAERFSSSLECLRLGRELRVPPDELWRAVRAQSPVTPRRFSILLDLLDVIVRAEVAHWQALERAKEIDLLRQTFLARVAHDLRTPLSVVALQVDALLDGGTEDARERTLAYERIRRSAAAQQRLIDDLVEVARTLTGTLTISQRQVDLTRILREVVDSMDLLARQKGLHLHRELGDGPVWIDGDETRLQQVFVNLTTNAVKFTPAAGTVTLRMSVVGDDALVEVIDSGVGLSAEIARSMFAPFSRTTENNEKGWGLGLSIAKQLIELHGGHIAADSAGPGHGTTVRTSLPLMRLARP